MKLRTHVLVWVALFFMSVFMCIGYAAVSNPMVISGAINAAPPEGIYLISSSLQGVSNAASSAAAHTPYTTAFDSTVNIQSASSGWWQTTYGTVTYKFTVLNNTAYRFAYSGLDYISSLAGYNGNAYIGNGLAITVTDEYGGSFTGDVIAPDQQVVFYATYTVNRSDLANTDLKTLVNFKFGVNVDSVGDAAIDTALSRFGEILNDTSEGGAYETLVDKIDDKYDGTGWKATYIGNVVGAHNADTETINELFQGRLSLTIDGIATNVTVLIKRENLDNNLQTGDDYTATYGSQSTSGYGCEMTLYMTTDPLESGSPVIYAAVFTCDRNDDGTLGPWYMLGDKYAGSASIVGYEGSYIGGSFDTGTWRSTSQTTYVASTDYSYTVPAGQAINTIILASDANAVSTLQTLVTKANDVLRGVYGEYAGTAIIALQEALDNAARCCATGSDGSVTVNASTTRAYAVPLIKELDHALTPFADIIK